MIIAAETQKCYLKKKIIFIYFMHSYNLLRSVPLDDHCNAKFTCEDYKLLLFDVKFFISLWAEEYNEMI